MILIIIKTLKKKKETETAVTSSSKIGLILQ
jgi:hypothetical protein